MSARQLILRQLTASRNTSVERAIEIVLVGAAPAEQIELAATLLERNRRGGWVALIRAYDHLDPSIQRQLVARPRDLFGPLAETMQDVEGPARENIIAIIQNCADARLVYLLAEALMDARQEVRELAGRSLLDAIRRYSNRTAESVADPEAVAQIRKAVDFALRRFRTHRQPQSLHAAFIQERQQDSTLWTLFNDPYDDLTRAATVTLRAPPEPALVPALILALGSPLKPAAMAGLAGIETAPMAIAVAAQSFRLIDPALRDAARGITHLKLLPAVRKDPPWNSTSWSDWLRLIESVGLQPVERLLWLSRMLEAIPPATESCAWKICVYRAIADTALPEAGSALATATKDPDERVARVAARLLTHHKIPEWRQLAADSLSKSPHRSVRNFAVMRLHHEDAPPGKNAKMPAARGFEKAWSDYQKMPPALQHTTARSVASDPAYAEQLRHKLGSGSPQDIAQGLKMLMALPNLAPYRNHIIGLCGHDDPRIAAMAVRLIGRLEDPKLKDLLEAATQHADARVRANAIESMEELHIADRSQQILSMLNSRHNRERANAIKALGQFNFATARECLTRMLSDANPLHRMSALWVVGQLQMMEIMRQVSALARRDPNMRVRKRAVEMLETLTGNVSTPS